MEEVAPEDQADGQHGNSQQNTYWSKKETARKQRQKDGQRLQSEWFAQNPGSDEEAFGDLDEHPTTERG